MDWGKAILYVVIGLVVVGVAVWAVQQLLTLIVPILVLGAIGYGVYHFGFKRRKALRGGGRSLL